MPVRKRTALVDQRVSRSRLGAKADPRELLEQQHALQNPPRAVSPSPIMSRLASASALGLGMPLRKGLEVQQQAIEQSVKITPPTPQPPMEEGRVPDPPDPEIPEDDSITSPTASILESMEMFASSGDADAPVATGASGLKRATSGEVTRMRGPRGESPSV